MRVSGDPLTNNVFVVQNDDPFLVGIGTRHNPPPLDSWCALPEGDRKLAERSRVKLKLDLPDMERSGRHYRHSLMMTLPRSNGALPSMMSVMK